MLPTGALLTEVLTRLRARGATLGAWPSNCYVNLPCRGTSISLLQFFTALGFSFNPDFTDENATCMIVNDDAFVMLLVESYFKTFTSRSVASAADTAEVIMSFSLESREAVDEAIRTALKSGGKASEEAQDYGFMYTHSFQDPDGAPLGSLLDGPGRAPRTPRSSRGSRAGAPSVCVGRLHA